MIDLSEKISQSEFGAMVGISQPAVSDCIARRVLLPGASAGEWLLCYCRHLREVAAGRQGDGDGDLVAERTRLAKEQADKIAMQNAVERRELAPVAAMELVLAQVGSKVGKILDTVPGMVRRRVPGAGAEVIEAIAGDIAKCRNMIAGMKLADLEGEGSDDGDGDEDFAEVAAA